MFGFGTEMSGREQVGGGTGTEEGATKWFAQLLFNFQNMPTDPADKVSYFTSELALQK